MTHSNSNPKNRLNDNSALSMLSKTIILSTWVTIDEKLAVATLISLSAVTFESTKLVVAVMVESLMLMLISLIAVSGWSLTVSINTFFIPPNT